MYQIEKVLKTIKNSLNYIIIIFYNYIENLKKIIKKLFKD